MAVGRLGETQFPPFCPDFLLHGKKLPVKEEWQFTYQSEADLLVLLVTACLLEPSWEIPIWKRREVKITVAVLRTLLRLIHAERHLRSRWGKTAAVVLYHEPIDILYARPHFKRHLKRHFLVPFSFCFLRLLEIQHPRCVLPRARVGWVLRKGPRSTRR